MPTDAEILTRLKEIVREQAADWGLWFVAQTAPEAYLQNALRRVHAAIEGDDDMLKMIEYEVDADDILAGD